MSWLVYCHIIISACPLCGAAYCRLWLILSKLFWIYYSLIQSMAARASVVYVPKGKWKERECTVILMKLQRAAFSGIIWFGDLNAFALRQLLI